MRRFLFRVAVVAAFVGLVPSLAGAAGLATGASSPESEPAQEREVATFSDLTVVSFGDQEVDIFTGVTTLPDGGRIISREHDLSLVGETIRYQEGEFVEAEGVQAQTEFATASAHSLRIDLSSGDMEAVGNIRFSNEQLSASASALSYAAGPGVMTLEGPVTGENPRFEATSMVLDVDSGTLLLVGPYRYQDDLFELSSEREGAVLSLTTVEGDTTELRASSEVDPALLERLAPYLP